MNYDILAKKADLLLDSLEYKFITSSHDKLYEALSKASHSLYAAKRGDFNNMDLLNKSIKLTQAIPNTDIQNWIHQKEWKNLV